jgi:glycosyltransferase involved in cell wall biosynthesis
MENKVCVYAITKNEEQFVEKWYNSMKEADAVVVLDTGSTDKTVEKLRALGATVVVKEINPWRFDVARNESLKLVPDDCNILLSTDLDEVLEPGWSIPLKEKWIEGKHERGVYKYSWSHLPNGESGRVFRYDKIHSRKWIWKAPVHELLYNTETGSNLYYGENVLDLFDEMHLHHYPDRSKSRASYLPLLELRAKENPEDYYGLIYLAHEYYYRGKYNESIKLLNDILDKHAKKYNNIEKASCFLFMGDSHVALSKEHKDINKSIELNNAIHCYLNAIMIDDTYIEPYLNLAKVYIELKMYDSAEFYIKKGIAKSYRHYTWVERDTSWSYEPWDLLCLATFYSGNKKDSILYATKALSFEPENKRLKGNLEKCLKLTDNKELI